VDLWIDDRADLAALFPVAGVHVGQRDLPPAAVRRALGEAGGTVRIGLSTHTEAQVEAAESDPAVDWWRWDRSSPRRARRGRTRSSGSISCAGRGS